VNDTLENVSGHYKQVASFYSWCDISGAPNGSFRGISVRKKKIALKYSDLIAVKTRDFFGETSPQTFVTRGLINSCCFRMDKYDV